MCMMRKSERKQREVDLTWSMIKREPKVAPLKLSRSSQGPEALPAKLRYTLAHFYQTLTCPTAVFFQKSVTKSTIYNILPSGMAVFVCNKDYAAAAL